MEEKSDSDIDILVDLDSTVPLGLMQYAGMINKLEELLDRKVDLVTDGTVKYLGTILSVCGTSWSIAMPVYSRICSGTLHWFTYLYLKDR